MEPNRYGCRFVEPYMGEDEFAPFPFLYPGEEHESFEDDRPPLWSDCEDTDRSIGPPYAGGDWDEDDDGYHQDYWDEYGLVEAAIPLWYEWDECVGKAGIRRNCRLQARKSDPRYQHCWGRDRRCWKTRRHGDKRLGQWDRGPERDTAERRRDARRGYYFYNQHD